MYNTEHKQLDNLIEFYGEQTNVQYIRKLGKLNDNRKQLRTLLVTMRIPWELRKICAKGRKLPNYDISVVLLIAVNQLDFQNEKSILLKCPKTSRVPKLDIRTKNQHLYIKDQNVKLKGKSKESAKRNCFETASKSKLTTKILLVA